MYPNSLRVTHNNLNKQKMMKIWYLSVLWWFVLDKLGLVCWNYLYCRLGRIIPEFSSTIIQWKPCKLSINEWRSGIIDIIIDSIKKRDQSFNEENPVNITFNLVILGLWPVCAQKAVSELAERFVRMRQLISSLSPGVIMNWRGSRWERIYLDKFSY